MPLKSIDQIAEDKALGNLEYLEPLSFSGGLLIIGAVIMAIGVLGMLFSLLSGPHIPPAPLAVVNPEEFKQFQSLLVEGLQQGSLMSGICVQGQTQGNVAASLTWYDDLKSATGWVYYPQYKAKKAVYGVIVTNAMCKPVFRLQEQGIIDPEKGSGNALTHMTYWLNIKAVDGRLALSGPWQQDSYRGTLEIQTRPKQFDAMKEEMLELLRKCATYRGLSTQSRGNRYEADASLCWNDSIGQAGGWIALPELNSRELLQGLIVAGRDGVPVLQLRESTAMSKSNGHPGAAYFLTVDHSENTPRLVGTWESPNASGNVTLDAL